MNIWTHARPCMSVNTHSRTIGFITLAYRINPSSSKMVVSHGRDWEPSRFSAHLAGWLNSPDVALEEASRIPEELLIYRLWWNPKEADCTISQWGNVKATGQPAWGQAAGKGQLPSFPALSSGLPPGSGAERSHPHVGWVFVLQIISSRKSHPGVPSSFWFIWFRIQSGWQLRLAVTDG